MFVPATLEDNPSIDAAEYEPSLMQLDPLTRRQLRYGDWLAKQDGGVFKSDWMRYYERFNEHYLLGREKRPIKISSCSRFAAADIAGTEKRDGNNPDYTVIQIWDVTPNGDMILVEQFRDRYEIPDVEEKLMGLCWQWNVPYAVVEKNGIGLGVVQTCRKRGLAVKAIIAKRDKFARSQVAQIRMESGTVYFPVGRAWMDDLESELLAFPCEGMHDDIVDCFSQAAAHTQKALGGPIRDNRDDEFDSQKSAEEERELANQRLLEEQSLEEMREAHMWRGVSCN
jgi:predicted phage terminase large subunit-like protein